MLSPRRSDRSDSLREYARLRMGHPSISGRLRLGKSAASIRKLRTGIRSGISIPVNSTACRHVSMLTLASSKPSLSLDKDIDQIAAVTAVAYFHAALEAHRAQPTAFNRCRLTPRQALCLKWSA